MPEIQLNGKTIATQTGTNEPVLKNNVVMESGFSIPSGVINSALSGATFPAGHILNVWSKTKTSVDSHTSSAWKEITALTHTVANPNSGSNFLLSGHINGAWETTVTKIGIRLTRTDSNGEVDIALGDADGNRSRGHGVLYLQSTNYAAFPMAINYLDTSASTTSSITYKVYFAALDNAGTVWINRGHTSSNVYSQLRNVSTFTVMEIKS